ncbi:MAG TPA: hypothetical protein VKV21_13525 [Solirubrobacteraceae bacterium]|nr:hypothetical protein [Solirubrobacteraceae bacterium]
MFLARRMHDVDAAAALWSECWAVAFEDWAHCRADGPGEAEGWVFGIARHQLARYYRSGEIKHRALQRLRWSVSAVDGLLDEELDAENRVDVIVVAGNVVGGPLAREALELVGARPERVAWIADNAERETVAAWDGAPVADSEPGRAAAWSAEAIDRGWRDRLASWPVELRLDGICFCHGSPRQDDEILTRLTPERVLREALGGVSEPLVVGGHTHQQTIRGLAGGPTYVNAGRVGQPYEGRVGAFWLLIENGTPSLRETRYDLDAAVRELRSSGFGDVESQLAESLLTPADPDHVAGFFERLAGREPQPAQGFDLGGRPG